jgi:predicted ATP-grasp superfamily ATP-dependent carboligase
MSPAARDSGRPGGPDQPVALVLGLTIHGLAVCRALARAGVPVHAFAMAGGLPRPTAFTRYARVHFREALNSPALVEHIRDFCAGLPGNGPVVLFPTSDRMAEAIARGWDRLSGRCVLSWAHCRDLVLELQNKDNLPRRAEATGVPFPRSGRLTAPGQGTALLAALRAPVILKPARPLSGFKALVARTPAEVEDIVARHRDDLPFVVQEFIEGGEGSLYACTTYLDHGRELGMFTSRKLAASPPGLGQGTVFTGEEVEPIKDLTRRFLAGLDLSGPVALEYKRDPAGNFWLIEPNVGRTEYCVDLAIQSGFNLPLLEFRHALGLPLEGVLPGRLSQRTWFDTDKDPLCHRRFGKDGRGDAVFPYRGHGDPLPAVAAGAWTVGRGLRELAAGAWRRLRPRN